MSEQRRVRFSTLGELTKNELHLAIEVWFEDAMKAPWASKETMKLAGILHLYMMNPSTDCLSLKMVEDFYQVNADSARRALVLFTLYGMIDAHSIDGNELRAALRLSRLQTLRVLEARQRLAELSGAGQCDVGPKPIKSTEKVWLPGAVVTVSVPAVADAHVANAGDAEVGHSVAAEGAKGNAQALVNDVEWPNEPMPATAEPPQSQACSPQPVAPQSSTKLGSPVAAVSPPGAPTEQFSSTHDGRHDATCIAASCAGVEELGVEELCEPPAPDEEDVDGAEHGDIAMRLRKFRQAAEKCSHPTDTTGWNEAGPQVGQATGAAPQPGRELSGQDALARSLARLRRRA